MADAYDVGLGLAIAELRTSRGLSRPDLAEMSTLSYPYVYELERGKKKASDNALEKIAGALEVSPRDLMDRGKELMPEYEATPPPDVITTGGSPRGQDSDAVERIVASVLKQIEPAVRAAVKQEMQRP